MADKKKKKASDQDVFDVKIFYSKIIKRYLIIIAIAFVPVAILNYFVLKNLSAANMIMIDIAILLLACFIGIIIFSHIDKKNENKPRFKEDERDPFAD